MKSNMPRRGSIVVMVLSFAFLSVGISKDAHAVAQWARKYNVNCQTCHTAFPRLSYFGEQFKRNGYQMPETQDGDETKKKVGENKLFIDELGNLMGIRISVTPVKVEMNQLTTNGEKKIRTSFGNPDWVQFFVAGSIFKDASIFIEPEVQDKSIKTNWFYLGYHNILDTSLLNVKVGKLSPMDNLGQSGRLRMIPSLKIATLADFKSGGAYAAAAQEKTLGGGITAANSTHDDEVSIESPQPSVEVYGYQKYFLYSVGVTNGSSLSDSNEYKNFFGTLRFDIPEGPLVGSNIAGFGYLGWDTSNNSRNRQADRFWRTAGSANLRYDKFDVVALFIYGKDDNWDLLTNLEQTTKGISGQVGYLISSNWFTALQYDWVNGTDGSDNFSKVSPVLTYMPRENMRVDLGGRVDVNDTAGGRQHEGFVNIRSMF
ncbi:MAG: hypothetical protein Q7S98_02415 [Deltaproteobacteria bacterium]|nr:hypothetical protein [Deltaproteobacteria bacterium]